MKDMASELTVCDYLNMKGCKHHKRDYYTRTEHDWKCRDCCATGWHFLDDNIDKLIAFASNEREQSEG